MNNNNNKGWIGVDLDGTLAHYDGWQGVEHIGDPVPKMLERVKNWLAEGYEVRIFTARACGNPARVRCMYDTEKVIKDWCLLHVGQVLPITAKKDFDMIELWDDRAVRVCFNTGERIL